MSEPEIARRCPSCRASIRQVAHFCPQCGIELPRQGSVHTNPLLAPTLEDTIFEAAPHKSDTEPLKDVASERVRQPEKPPKQAVPKVSKTETGKGSVGQAALGAVGAQIQRATMLARDVEGDVKHRVQKARQISSVVLDEAGYDPSLRFVLVAAVLFVLFLIIVLLNKFIT